MSFLRFVLPFLIGVALMSPAAASDTMQRLDLTSHWVGPLSLVLFFVAYLFVMAEEFTHLRKSKPAMLAAGLIWGLIGWVYANNGIPHAAEIAVRHNLLEYAELMLFLLAAMTYINAMDERFVFEALRSWLVRKGFSLRTLFWVTGGLAFFISPLADNLTTALLMAAVLTAVAGANKSFILLGCINIVVAANAGGAFSPFGDITTLMVWQKNIQASNGPITFWTFFVLFIPALIPPHKQSTRLISDPEHRLAMINLAIESNACCAITSAATAPRSPPAPMWWWPVHRPPARPAQN